MRAVIYSPKTAGEQEVLLDEIIKWTATQTAAKIRDRAVSVSEVTRAHLARIGECEPGLRAVVEVFEEDSLQLAKAQDDQAGPDAPPLLGLPTTIKINVDYAGHPNSNGIPALNETPAEMDSPVVTNLKGDGIVPIGRTNTPEFSLRWFTSNPIYGASLNPVNPTLTPGGSSGGAAAAVATGMGVLGHGNDLGGSLRYPAYCCGLATLRPSMGKVPAFNPSAPAERPASLQMMSVQGTIARCIKDVRLALASAAKRSSIDPLWNAAPNSGRSRGERLTIGIAHDPFGDGIAPEVAAAVDLAASVLEKQGHRIVAATPPLVDEAARTWGQLLNAETDVMMRDTMEPVASSDLLSTLNTYADIYGIPDLRGFMQAQAMRLTILRAWNLMFDEVDVLVMPVSARPPFALEQDFRQPDTLPDIMQANRFMFPVNVLGLPAATVPTGIDDGVPMGVQIIGACRDDDLCLDVAEEIERSLDLRITPVDPRDG